MDPETERIGAIYDRRGTSLTPRDGNWLFGDSRAWVASKASGETLEVGIGEGLTIRHYPPDVRLTGIDPSTTMLAHASAAAAAAGRKVDLRVGDAMRLDLPDRAVDTVVFCLVLCTVPDDRQAILEAARVLRPGGRFVAVEHVRSPNRLVRLIERAWEPISIRMDGDHLLRDPADHLPAAGFAIESLERGRFGIVERVVAVRTD
jgi:SAM-dependent methyltransferase